jgi:hypothetical protein
MVQAQDRNRVAMNNEISDNLDLRAVDILEIQEILGNLKTTKRPELQYQI